MKKFLIATCAIMCANVLMAQPTPTGTPTSPANDPTGKGGDGIRRAPIAPATLLLLGLGGAAVGTMVYRNTKNKKEE
ncbi:MAG: hypothetical protein U0L53_05150 [Bacteroidales bacterium]|nr:hypothetical protein [Bacteroidales bacterium]